MDIIAHRGLGHPENTIISFERAIEKGFPYVELDVHLSRDQRWVVYHDFFIQGKMIEKLSYDEIEELLPQENKPPCLEDVFALAKNLRLNVELKVHPSEPDPRKLGDKLANFLLEQTSVDRINVSSFNSKSLIGVRSASKEIRLSFLSLRPNPKKWDQLNRKLRGLYSVNPMFLLLRKKHVDKAHNLDIKVHPWTVNRDKWIKRMIKLNVDGIITDVPEKVASALQSFSNKDIV